MQCCVDLSRGTAYGLCMSQLVFTVGCIMFSPTKQVTLYTLTTPTNTSNLEVHSTEVHIQTFMGVVSFIALFFGMQTMNFMDSEHMEIDYNLEFVEKSMMWNMLFWLYVFGAHFLSFSIVLNVSDVYLLILATCVVQYCLFKACLPRSLNDLNITRENTYLLGYASGVFMVAYNSQKPELLLWIVLIDYALGVGHAWDKQATIDTVVNCRLFYACCQSFMLCLYYTWKW